MSAPDTVDRLSTSQLDGARTSVFGTGMVSATCSWTGLLTEVQPAPTARSASRVMRSCQACTFGPCTCFTILGRDRPRGTLGDRFTPRDDPRCSIRVGPRSTFVLESDGSVTDSDPATIRFPFSAPQAATIRHLGPLECRRAAACSYCASPRSTGCPGLCSAGRRGANPRRSIDRR